MPVGSVPSRLSLGGQASRSDQLGAKFMSSWARSLDVLSFWGGMQQDKKKAEEPGCGEKGT